MEDDTVSVISNAEVKLANSDVSDSISTTHPANKRIKHNATNNGGFGGGRGISSSSSSQYKGVIRLKTGQWGAQLYANHTRIWLGTFKSELEAAAAYDSAAIKLRNGDTHRNFPWNEINMEEPNFQSHYSDGDVLSMIKDGSYHYKFMNYLEYINTNLRGSEQGIINLDSIGIYSNEGLTCKQLFQKELTPSDVGKLNRLVIPKKFAVKYFPLVKEKVVVVGNGNDNVKGNDMELSFYDKFMRLWKFRYCYWNSSQNFVFTRGWSQFLRAKNLKAKDVITFYECEQIKENNEVHRFCMIDSSELGNNDDLIEAANLQVGREVDLQLRLGPSCRHGGNYDLVKVKTEFVEERCNQQEHDQSMIAAEQHNKKAAEGFKLFGVLIK